MSLISAARKVALESVSTPGSPCRQVIRAERAVNAGTPAFGRAALKQAESLPDLSGELARREKVKGVTLSIDAEKSRDLDDVLSFHVEPDGTRVVGIHISDVGAYIRPGSPLDFAARLRNESQYLDTPQGQWVSPALPTSLSTDLLSLNPGVPRLTKSFELRFDPDGNVVGERLFNSVTVNQHRLTQETAAHAMASSRQGRRQELQEALNQLSELAGLVGGGKGGRVSPKRLVQRFMEESSGRVARILSDANVETSYRNGLGKYVPFPDEHAPQRYAQYVHWTSPIRRYQDLDVHRAIDRFLSGRVRSARAEEIDHRLRGIQHARANQTQPVRLRPKAD